jgi:hypothetical protein
MLAGAGRLTLSSWTEVFRGTGPVDLGSFKIVEPEEGDPLFLILDGALADAVDEVRRGDQHAVREHCSTRLGQELVYVTLCDPIGGVIRLGLDRPQVSVAVLGHQVDASVASPPAGLLVPQPDPAKLMGVDRVVG